MISNATGLSVNGCQVTEVEAVIDHMILVKVVLNEISKKNLMS